MYFNPNTDVLHFSETQKMMPVMFGTQDNVNATGRVGNVFAYDRRLKKRVQLRRGDLAIIEFGAFKTKDENVSYNRYFVPTPRQREVYNSMKRKAKSFTKRHCGL